MQLVEFTEQDITRYNTFVATVSNGSFLQAWEWGDLQHDYNKHEIFRVGITEDDQILLTAQVVKMQIIASAYYLYVPYGPVYNFENNEALLKYFVAAIKEKFSDALFIRIEPKFKSLYSIPGDKTLNIQPGRSLLVDLSKAEGEILAQMHHKTRYNIKIAQKHEVRVEKEFAITNGHGLFYAEAIDLILDTAKRQGFMTHPKQYYEKLINFFALHNRGGGIVVAIYKAIYEKQLLATAIMIDFGSTRTYLFGGSSNDFRNVMAPYLLHYQAMLDAKEQGRTWYDFDGLETSVGKHAGFARFKLGFGGQVAEYAGAHDIVLQRSWYSAYRMLRSGNRLLKKIRL